MKIEFNYRCEKCGAPRTVEVEADGFSLVNKQKIKLRCPSAATRARSGVGCVVPDRSDVEIKRLIRRSIAIRARQFPEAQWRACQMWHPGSAADSLRTNSTAQDVHRLLAGARELRHMSPPSATTAARFARRWRPVSVSVALEWNDGCNRAGAAAR